MQSDSHGAGDGFSQFLLQEKEACFCFLCCEHLLGSVTMLVLALQHCSVSLHLHWTLSRWCQFGFRTQYISCSAECNCFDGSLTSSPLVLNVDALSVSIIVFRAAWKFLKDEMWFCFKLYFYIIYIYCPWLPKILIFTFSIEIKKGEIKKINICIQTYAFLYTVV